MAWTEYNTFRIGHRFLVVVLCKIIQLEINALDNLLLIKDDREYEEMSILHPVVLKEET
jgi:hypothetical protein